MKRPCNEAPVHEVGGRACACAAPDGRQPLGHAPRRGRRAVVLPHAERASCAAGGGRARTVVQGVIAPELARAVSVASDCRGGGADRPDAAYSVGSPHRVADPQRKRRAGRRPGLRQRTRRSATTAACRVASGRGSSLPGSLGRRLRRAGADDRLARSNPALAGAAQAAAAIQVIAHLRAQFREALRPAINTVHVGNGDPNVRAAARGGTCVPPMSPGRCAAPSGPRRRNHRHGHAAADTAHAQTASPRGRPRARPGRRCGRHREAWAPVLTSSVEDHLVDTASALRMREMTRHGRGSETPVRPSVSIYAIRSLAANSVGRAERADTRIFNTMVPGLIALGVVQALRSTLSQPGVSANERQAAQAGACMRRSRGWWAAAARADRRVVSAQRHGTQPQCRAAGRGAARAALIARLRDSMRSR